MKDQKMQSVFDMVMAAARATKNVAGDLDLAEVISLCGSILKVRADNTDEAKIERLQEMLWRDLAEFVNDHVF